MKKDLKRSPTPDDFYASKKLAELRAASGQPLVEVGVATGKTWQQFQKYEKGVNRMSAGFIASVAKHFKVSPSVFFKYKGPKNEKG